LTEVAKRGVKVRILTNSLAASEPSQRQRLRHRARVDDERISPRTVHGALPMPIIKSMWLAVAAVGIATAWFARSLRRTAAQVSLPTLRDADPFGEADQQVPVLQTEVDLRRWRLVAHQPRR
jgi:hypothetical protein